MTSKRTGNETVFKFPTTCPECGSKVVKEIAAGGQPIAFLILGAAAVGATIYFGSEESGRQIVAHFANLFVDVAYAFLDPRVRYQ